MRLCPDPEDIPWWRVVLKNGGIATDKLDPELGLLQRRRLDAEGVPLTDDRVDMERAGWTP
jgi:methylated-DNA-protein-cysteine methyltransferase-like protein